MDFGSKGTTGVSNSIGGVKGKQCDTATESCLDFTPFWSVEDIQSLQNQEPTLNMKLEQVATRMVPCQN